MTHTLSLSGMYPIFPMRNKAHTPLKVASCKRETGPSLTHSQSKPNTPSDKLLKSKKNIYSKLNSTLLKLKKN